MKLRNLPLLWCSLALFIGGCPKRQAPPRIVYVPAPPPSAMQAPGPEGAPVMVIEEPPPPEPAPAPQPETPAPKETPPQHRRPARREPTAAAPESTPETTEQPAPQVPSLEPHESSMEQATLRREIQGLQDDVRQRMARLNTAGLSGMDSKTLADARTFFDQSTQALNEGDLQRALTLARKASLLVLALEH